VQRLPHTPNKLRHTLWYGKSLQWKGRREGVRGGLPDQQSQQSTVVPRPPHIISTPTLPATGKERLRFTPALAAALRCRRLAAPPRVPLSLW
jgi:hypothetical protein